MMSLFGRLTWMNGESLPLNHTERTSAIELLAWAGSGVSASTVMVSKKSPGRVGCTTILTTATAPLVSLPSPQLTTPLAKLHEPLVVEAETKVDPEGI